MSAAKRSSALVNTLKQTRPFASSEEEAYLSIIRTAAQLSHAVDQWLKPYGITQPQYNVLRILRGAGEGGLCRNEIRDRMVNAMPDMTRLLDRMEKTGLIGRDRSTQDRRQVATHIRPMGKTLLRRMDKPLSRLHLRQFRGTPAAELRRLLMTLEGVRERLADFRIVLGVRTLK